MMNPDSNNQNIPKGLDDLLGSIRSDSEILGEDYDQNMPEGLNDLLNSIRNEKPSNALALYVPDSREEDLVSEQIDERILNLLGLDDAIDLDYATYKSLLREKMMAGRLSNTNMVTEETELLTNEFKRVKGNTGRFKVKKDKINFTSFVSETSKRGKESSSPSSPMISLPPAGTSKAEVDSPEEEKTGKIEGIQKFLGDVSERLGKIEKNLSDMLDLESEQIANEKKDVEGDRITGEKQKKRKKENNLESSALGSVGKTITDKVTAPVKGFFDTLINFFTQIFLGSAVQWLMKAINNPMMFFNPFISMINGVINLLNGTVSFLFGGIFDGINVFVGLLNGGLGNLENMINGVFGLFGEVEEEDKVDLPDIPKAEVPQIPNIPYFKPEAPKKEESTPVKGMAGGGEVEGAKVAGYKEGGQVINLNVGGWKGGTNVMKPIVGMAGGGMIAMSNIVNPPVEISNMGFAGGGSITGSSGQTITGMGPDTQLIAAQPGEIVMSKKAVQSYGANNLLAMNRDAGGTNIPTMGSVQGFSGGGQVGAQMTLSSDAQYDVIIPLDHTRKPGTIPDTAGGGTFKASNATGAAGREREAQDPAAKIIADRMAKQGFRVRIYSPEDAGDYETYDKYLQQQAKMGVRIMPLHFDAGRDASGKIVGTGFLTRTRAGDTDDKRFADPIQEVLAEFQSANPDLGKIAQDTAGNTTVNKGEASPTALVELGIMTFWEKKYGKDFTSHPEFVQFANNIADAAVVGSGLKPNTTLMSIDPQTPMTPQRGDATKAKNTLAFIDKAMANIDERSANNTGSGDSVVIPGAGTYVEGTTMGFLPTNKYFNPSGEEISKSVFDERVSFLIKEQQDIISKAPSKTQVTPTTPSAQVAPTTPQQPNVPPPKSQGQASIMALPGGESASRPQNSTVASAGQKQVPSFSARDMGNPEFIVIKSIYNIVG